MKTMGKMTVKKIERHARQIMVLVLTDLKPAGKKNPPAGRLRPEAINEKSPAA